MRLFVTATGTEVGKTWVTAALVEALCARGRDAIGLKPVETGCDPVAQDAALLAGCSGDPALAEHPGFHRAVAPLAPWAAELSGGPPAPSVAELLQAIRAAGGSREDVLVEGAGGPLVPLTSTESFADLFAAAGWPVLLVSKDGLGTLSHTLSAFESLRARGVATLGIVLVRHRIELSQATNRTILERSLPCPVWHVGPWTSATGNAGDVADVVQHVLAGS